MNYISTPDHNKMTLNKILIPILDKKDFSISQLILVATMSDCIFLSVTFITSV